MRSPTPSADSDRAPGFLVRTAQGSYIVEANQAARDLLGMDDTAPAALPLAEIIASLTGRRFIEDIADLTQPTTVPGLLLGAGYRVIPAMLECQRTGDVILVRASETGNPDILRRGVVDTGAMLQAAIDVAPGSIITIDELGSILSFNKAAQIAFGYTEDEAVGQNVAVLMPRGDAAAHEEHLRHYLHTGERHIIGAMRVVEARRKNGATFPVELYIDEVRCGDRRLYVGFLRDISHRRELQAETVTLQRELIHVTRLASMGEMAAALAHELNQPLTAIAAFAETARLQLQALGEDAPAPARESLAKVAAQAVRAGEVIRRMRQLAVGGAGQRDPEDLNAIVREAKTLAAIGAKSLAIETSIIETRHIPPVVCDRIQVQQVIINLVRNAIDAFDEDEASHRPGRGPRRITIETEVDRRQAMVSVRDNGPGVPADIVEHLFDSFLTTKALGVGLGLPISRMIIESHGGKLWFDPQSGHGAIFRFTLPLQVTEWVVIVDDDEDVCEALTALLRAAGHSTRAYNTLGAFRASLGSEAAPAVIVLDVRLPDGSGVDFLPELLTLAPRGAVIVMTGHGDISLAVAAMKAGARDFLEKPFDPQELLAAVARMLEAAPDLDAARHTAELDARERFAALTARERDVLKWLVRGASTKEIARQLSLSPRTVETHRANLMTKTGAKSLSTLLRLAILAGFRGDGAA